MKTKVVSLDTLSERTREMILSNLNSDIEVVFFDSYEESVAELNSADVLVTFTRGIPKSVIDNATSCRLIQKLGAGVNNIDIKAASERGIPVCNIKGGNSRAVAEHTILLMMALYRQIIVAHNEIVKEDKWLKTELRDNSFQLSYKKVGLIGFGAIGRSVSKILQGFGCDVRYFDLYRLSEDEERTLQVQFVGLEELISSSDVISLHIPLTEETYHLIDSDALSKMKNTVVIVNTCRGGVIDEEALYAHLKNGRMLGAGLDVFETEPVPAGHPLKTLNNVVLTPHFAGGTVEAIDAVTGRACANINHFLVHGSLPNPLDVVNLVELQANGFFQ